VSGVAYLAAIAGCATILAVLALLLSLVTRRFAAGYARGVVSVALAWTICIGISAIGVRAGRQNWGDVLLQYTAAAFVVILIWGFVQRLRVARAG